MALVAFLQNGLHLEHALLSTHCWEVEVWKPLLSFKMRRCIKEELVKEYWFGLRKLQETVHRWQTTSLSPCSPSHPNLVRPYLVLHLLSQGLGCWFSHTKNEWPKVLIRLRQLTHRTYTKVYQQWSSGFNVCHQDRQSFESQARRSLWYWMAIRLSLGPLQHLTLSGSVPL